MKALGNFKVLYMWENEGTMTDEQQVAYWSEFMDMCRGDKCE